jgi:hypothetical protein
MIVRLGDTATDAANAYDAGFISTVVAQQPFDLAANTAPPVTTDYSGSMMALVKILDPNAYSSTLPIGSPTINSSGQVVPSTNVSGASGVGGALSQLMSNIFGGGSSTPKTSVYSANTGSSILGMSTNTVNLMLLGVVGILVVVAISGGKKR